MSYIKANNLSYSYMSDGAPQFALNGVTMDIKSGEFITIIGHNGSGKSTLAKQFNAMLLPSGGSCFVMGMDTRDEENCYNIRALCGLILQNPDNQIVAAIVEEDVAFAPENLGVAQAEIRERVDEALKAVGMTEYAKHAPHKLSGGQKQRVAIAGILAMKPKCIVLDEPTAMLDPVGRREVLNAVHALNREHGITVVLITHFMDEAVSADRVIVLSEGEIALEGTPREVFSHVGRIRELGLSVPQATKLCYELKKAGLSLPDGILTADECVECILLLKERYGQQA